MKAIISLSLMHISGAVLGNLTVNIVVSLDYGTHLPLIGKMLAVQLADPYQVFSVDWIHT